MKIFNFYNRFILTAGGSFLVKDIAKMFYDLQCAVILCRVRKKSTRIGIGIMLKWFYDYQMRIRENIKKH